MTFRLALLAAPLLWLLAGLWRLWPRLGQPEVWTSGDDWLTYLTTMTAVLDGQWLGLPRALDVSTLAYPYALAGLSLTVGTAPANLYLAQHVVVGAACSVLAVVARQLWGARAGWMALAGALGYTALDLRAYTVVLLPEAVSLLVIALMLLALHRFLVAPTIGTAAVAGLVLGLAVLTRFALLPFALVTLGWIVWRRA